MLWIDSRIFFPNWKLTSSWLELNKVLIDTVVTFPAKLSDLETEKLGGSWGS